MCEEQNAKDIKVKEDDRDPLKEGVRKLGDTIQLLINAIKPIADIMQMAFKTLAEQKEKALASCSKRVRHLALHGRAERVRKKNWKRVWKEYIKGVRHAERLVGESK